MWSTRRCPLRWMEWRSRIGRTGRVGNQSRATSTGSPFYPVDFFFSWMEWRSRIGRTGRVGNQSRATSIGPPSDKGQQDRPSQGNSFQDCTTRGRIADNIKALPPDKSSGVLPWRKRLFLGSSYKRTKFFYASPDSAPRQTGEQLKKKKKRRKREKEGGNC